jgi:hypothetical protein
MTTTVVVSTGLCSAIRPKVLTALRPYGFAESDIETWGEGRYGVKGTSLLRFPDSDIWVQKHVAVVTVSDARAKWCERLLWQAGNVWLDSPPRNPRLVWTAPPDCKAGAHGTLGRGTMPTPWSSKAKQPAPPRGILGIFAGLFGSTPAPPRRKRRQRKRRT